MVVTLQQILSPFFFISFIMGLNFISRKQPKIRWLAHLNILYSLILWSTYTYLLLYIRNNFSRKILFDSISEGIYEGSNFLVSIMSVTMSFYHQKRFEISIKKLAAVDDTLEKLGTPRMYKKLYIKSKQIVIGWIVYSLIMNFVETLWWLKFNETADWGLYIAFTINYCVNVNVFVVMMFIFFLWYIGTRFDKVKEHMQCLLLKDDYGLRCMRWKKSIIVPPRCIYYKQALWTSMHLYLELLRLTRELNLIFTLQITFEMVFNFLHITSHFYFLYWMLIQKQEKMHTLYDWFNIICYSLIHFIKIYSINYICEHVTIKANKIGKLCHQLIHIHRYDNREEVYQFILQTMHNPLKFTAMGLFDLGYGFLRKFCMAVVVYVIIMVQLKTFTIY